MPRLLPLALTLVVAAPASGQVATLRATLDLRGPIADGWLDAEAEFVGLRGSRAPLDWSATTRAADPDGDGVYALTVEVPVEADSVVLAYKIKVDGADNPNDGWQEGEDHTVVLRPGEDVEITLGWPDRPPEAPAVLTGRIDTIAGVEAEGLAPRDVYVWLPPGYEDSDRRYPVLYLHDGQAVFGVGRSDEWGMDEAATALVEAGEIAPLIIVAVANTEARIDEYTPTQRLWRRDITRTGPPTGTGPDSALTGAFTASDGQQVVVRETMKGLEAETPDGVVPLLPEVDGTYSIEPDVTLAFERDAEGTVSRVIATRPPAGGLGDAYGRLLTDTVKPLIDARYRTRPEAEHTGLGGSSLGGLISMHLGLTRPDVFGRLLVASPSVWWDDKGILRSVAEAEPHPTQRVWVDIGTEEGDMMVPDARRLAELLVERGWDAAHVRYVEAEGAGHETRAWQARVPDMLRFLFPPEAQ